MHIGYCEHQRDHGIAQPINTISALGFVVVALIIYTTTSNMMATITATLLLILGVTTALMHGMAEHWALKSDESAMFALLGWFILCYLMVLAPSVPTSTFVIMYILFLFIIVSNAIWNTSTHLLPFIVFAIISFGIISYCVYHHPGEIKYFVTSIVLFIVALIIWRLSFDGGLLCYPKSWFQGHAVWHILTSVAFLYLWKHVSSICKKCK